jgi:hypothetical protein
MAEVFADELQTRFSHRITGKIDAGDSLNSQKGLDLFCTFLAQTIPAKTHHLQAPHFHDSAD